MLPNLPVLNHDIKPLISLNITKETPYERKPVLYVIKEGDTLTSIADAQGSSVARLWAANTDLTDPNLIEPGKPLEIPQDSETLTDRPMPVKVMVQVPVSTQISRPSNSYGTNGGFSVSRGDSSGNLYGYGYCTYYAKQMRPDLPNNLGNADTWAIRAAAQGFTVSDSPTVGSVAVAINYGHVAIVTGIHDGMVDVKEENYVGWGIISTRTAPISEFTYIH